MPSSAETSQVKKPLLIYSIDVEGGQSTLLVSPTGASLLVDAGWPDGDGRDAKRIALAMHDAGITSIDHLLVTHFHHDHVGGVPALIKLVPVGEFIDHGANREDDDTTRADFAAYEKAIAGKPRRVVHPGDTLGIPGFEALVLTADGAHLAAIPGIKPVPNPRCAAEQKWALDESENPRSIGILVTYGKFRFLDLGDLTKAREIEMVCPANPIPAIDLFLVSHHGMDMSNTHAFVDALHARVAIMDNGPLKGASAEAWQTVHESPGLEDLWQLHTAESSDARNSPDALIANLRGGADQAYWLKATVSADGSFSLTNPRTRQTKDYPRK